MSLKLIFLIMSTFLILLIAGIISSILSLSLALILVAKDKWTRYIAFYGTPLAAGVLLIAFRDLVPHAIEEGLSPKNAITGSIVGIMIFFLFEKISGGFHHHHEEDTESNKAQGWLFLTGDAFHNFVDGIALGGAFLVSPSTGIIAAIALAAHDLPQEVGEFGVQIRSGFTKRQTVIRNIFASMITIFAAVISYQFGNSLNLPMGYLYAGIGGFLLYIALSDIIPSIHRTETSRLGLQTLMLFIGLGIGFTVGSIAHQYVDATQDTHHTEQSIPHK
jgi:zinc and cadmium transporter